MDHFSELEIKFLADKLSLQDYHKFLIDMSGESVNTKQIRIEKYKVVQGRDIYYNLNGEILRYRYDGNGGMLTYKKRKSDKSIVDRVEIDLPFMSTVESRDVQRVMRFLGATEDFSIDKVSYIHNVSGMLNTDVPYEATLALYDVKRAEDDSKTSRFLEVEIERHNKCSSEDGLKILDKWSRMLKNNLSVEGPINKSLFELYTKGK